METVKEMFDEACEIAKARTLKPEYDGCTVHINATVGRIGGVPCITGFVISDWFGDCTVCSYCNGRER